MRGILIDPFEQKVTEVDYNGDYHSIYGLIGCDTFDVVRLGDGETLFVDDDGLLKDPEFFFVLNGQPLAGKGLILGTNDEGESVATKLTVDHIEGLVSYKRLRVAGWEDISHDNVIGHRPIFEKRE